VEEDHLERVAGILRLDQLRQGERHPFGRRESILAVEDHAVAAIEHQHGRARALIFPLHDHQVFVGHVNPAPCRVQRARGCIHRRLAIEDCRLTTDDWRLMTVD
jgi:hypothetical protein